MTETARFLNPAGRSDFLTLKWPIEVDGKVWEQIEVRRITTGELAAFIGSPEGTPPPNVVAPKAVLDALDAEDGFALEALVQRFFPRRSPVQTESGTTPTPKTGEASLGS